MVTTPKIELTHQELFQSGVIGVARHLSARNSNHTHKLNLTERDLNSWSVDIDGVGAEMAVSKYFGIYYQPPAWKEDDLPNGYEVRASTYNTGHLIIRPRDREAIYIFVVAKHPFFSIRGWFNSKDAITDKYYRPRDATGPEGWWVPQSDLKDIVELKNGA